MEIKIPKRFQEALGEDLCVECKAIYKKYEGFATTEMYFFPEYTDHSYSHIQYVLETANRLIPDETFSFLTSNDIFVLCLSVLFHDLGMHLKLKSIQVLFRSNIKDDIIEKGFADIWKDYIDKNKICDEISDLGEIDDECAEKHKDEIANFIRKYHPMIANIIALKGFPMVVETKDVFDDYSEKSKVSFYKLSGIVARSHGEDLRMMIDYLQDEYGMMWKTPYDSHIVYLMCIVRIADYLHITDDRINPYRLNLQDFKSKKSEIEFNKHKSVEYSQRIYGNPEYIYIEAKPFDCKTYIELIELIKGIQYELDTSWAVLGEVYDVKELKISIRRITSNIFTKEWKKRTTYIPDKLSFHFDIRLVDLLIEPLYGNSASYGVRELIQNATDACKTRVALYSENDYTPKVEIIIEEINEDKEQRCLKIVDNGVGMKLDVIKNHFLNIGSKFRDSNEWNNLKDDTKSNGEISQKNGKFGVGILSSYLLGDTIKVRTCNIGEKIEYTFETQRDTQLIEITKMPCDKDVNLGTTIEIKLKNDVDVDNLVLDEWYINDDVEINASINGKKRERNNLINLKNDNTAIEKNDSSSNVWERLELVSSNIEVYWTYDYRIEKMNLQGKDDKSITTYAPNLVCNGIIIPKKYDDKNKNSIVSIWPTIYIIDRNGELELNLSRDEVNGRLPFIDELEAVLLDQFIKQYKELINDNKLIRDNLVISSQFNLKNYVNQKIMFGKEGYALFNTFFIKKLMENANESMQVVRIWTRTNCGLSIDKILDKDTYFIYEGVGSHPTLKSRITNYLNGVPYYNATIYMPEKELRDYQNYAANVYKLSQKFIGETNIQTYKKTESGFCNDKLKLEMNIEEITLAIVYKASSFSNQYDGSEILKSLVSKDDDFLQWYRSVVLE